LNNLVAAALQIILFFVPANDVVTEVTMKSLLLIFLLAVASASALDLTTPDGQTYRNVRVTRIESNGLGIIHAGGAARIPFASLPDELRKRYAPVAVSVTDLLRQLADDLARNVTRDPVNIAVGNFLYEDTALMSPFSAWLRDELERTLAQTGKFRVITRERLGDLQNEWMFQGASVFEPGAGAAKITVEGIKAIVRGRFYYQPPSVTVSAELAWLEGGTVNKAKTLLPAAAVGARVAPASLPAASNTNTTPPAGMPALQLDTILRPYNLAQSQTNLADIERRVAKVPRQFQLQLMVEGARRDFSAGEPVSYRIASDTDCHIAVFCHQVDGSTVVLFPNRFNRNTRITAGQRVAIPGAAKGGFEIVIGPPFGADVVQVIACTQASALHRKLRDYDYTATAAYHGITRGMFVQGLTESLTENVSDTSAAKWSEAHVVLCTYPRMK